VGFCTVGGASIGLGWPIVCLFSLMVALTMGQVASAFPTAGGLYHWASILGGKGWGWLTAWFNLAGLVTVLAAINAGTYDFIVAAFQLPVDAHPKTWKAAGVSLITLSQAVFNHRGIRITTLLTDFSGWLILVVSTLLTGVLLWKAPGLDLSRLVTFANYSGLPADAAVFPRTENIPWLFALGFLLPAYTITGFDASAHTSEETIGAARNVPRGIVRSVLVSSLFGWIMLAAIVLAIPDMNAAAQQGGTVFFWIMREVLSSRLAGAFFVGISIAQYLCGLATLTSASRMTYAFARDGGLPFSHGFRSVSPTHKTPAVAIWAVSIVAILFMVFIPYTTIAAVCAVFLYISYVLPTAIGFFAHGRSWKTMGPWQIGRWYRPLAALSVLFCGFLIVIGMQPPNEQAVTIVGGAIGLLAVAWFGGVRTRFQGPPPTIMLNSVAPGGAASDSNNVRNM
jgi:amino acid transporter